LATRICSVWNSWEARFTGAASSLVMSRIRTLVSTATTALLDLILYRFSHLPQGLWFAAIGKTSYDIFQAGWRKWVQWTEKKTRCAFFDREFCSRLPIARFA
jgi:hypothetical protein